MALVDSLTRGDDEAWRRDFERWWAATPKGMPPFDRLFDLGMETPTTLGRALARDALHANHHSDEDAAHALLHWYGSGAGPWSGYPAYEDLAGLLLRELPLEAVLGLHANAMTKTELEGAARFLTGWSFWKGREALRAKVPVDLRRRLRAHVAEDKDPDKLNRFDAAWHGLGQ